MLFPYHMNAKMLMPPITHLILYRLPGAFPHSLPSLSFPSHTFLFCLEPPLYAEQILPHPQSASHSCLDWTLIRTYKNIASLALVLNGEVFTQPHILLGWEVDFLALQYYCQTKEEMKPAGPPIPLPMYHVTPSCHSHNDFFFKGLRSLSSFPEL